MSFHAITRLVSDSDQHNTINIPTIRLFFQKSPGKPKGDKRGIPELEFRALTGGLPARLASSDKDGMIQLPVENGQVTLELLSEGKQVATYDITVDDTPFAAADTPVGQQQRLRFLGYQLGHDGPTGDGVNADPAPKDITPRKPKVDPEEDDDDRKANEKAKKKREKRPGSVKETAFENLTFATERAILDFQADARISIDGVIGPVSRGRLVQEVGE